MRVAHPLVSLLLGLCSGCELDWDRQLNCKPNRLCDDLSSLCVPEDDGFGVCRPLIEPGHACSVTYPFDLASLAGSEVFAFGVIAQWPTPDNPSFYGVPVTQGIELAIDAINASRGLRLPGMPNRKLLAIACNEAAPADTADDALSYLEPLVDHLAGALHVPVIIGASTSGVTRRINETYLDGLDTLLLSPSATDDTLADLWRRNAAGREQQLFFRTVAPNNAQAAAMGAVQRQVMAALSRAKASPDVVTVFDIANSSSLNFHNLLSPLLEGRVTRIPFRADDAQSIAASARSIVERAPGMIIPLGAGEFVGFTTGDEMFRSMLHDIEAGWADPAARPWYVMGEGNRSNFQSALANWPDLADRLIGTAPGVRTSELYGNFRNYFLAYFQGRSPTLVGAQSSPGNLAESGYDAVYLLAYAATKASASGARLRGSELARALATFSCKSEDATTLAADKLEYVAHASALARAPDGCFDFEGASGQLDFAESKQSRQSTGSLEPASDIALWCLSHHGGSDDRTANLVDRYYDHERGEIVVTRMGSVLGFGEPGWCAHATR